ncbi:MAG TPA: hypothetical protein VK886_18305 [Vicinamibacterales bacterium]|nr:hypothetical protein [Vicinamibacterales bacterium]
MKAAYVTAPPISPAREAIYLPALFLTVAWLGGLRVAGRVTFAAPPLFSLVLAVLLVAILVRSGAFAPERLMHAERSLVANLNGLALIVALFAASAQAFTLATPVSGLPLLLFNAFLFVLLVNTLVASPDRVRVLRSLMVVFGAAFVLKFVVLAALFDPSGGTLKRVLQILLEGVTLGSLSQEPMHAASGYAAFFTLLLYLIGLAMLPVRPPRPPRTHSTLPARQGEP